MEPKMEEDKQLARLYDYTKFHIGIYLSFAGGIAALLGSEKAGWFVSTLVASNKRFILVALVLMVLAGMCGGVVASSSIECKTFEDFWNKKHGPQSISLLKFRGAMWAMLEHLFFWLSLLVLGYTVAIRFPNVETALVTKTESVTLLDCKAVCQHLPLSAAPKTGLPRNFICS
jgi:hypothetical protein